MSARTTVQVICRTTGVHMGHVTADGGVLLGDIEDAVRRRLPEGWTCGKIKHMDGQQFYLWLTPPPVAPIDLTFHIGTAPPSEQQESTGATEE